MPDVFDAGRRTSSDSSMTGAERTLTGSGSEADADHQRKATVDTPPAAATTADVRKPASGHGGEVGQQEPEPPLSTVVDESALGLSLDQKVQQVRELDKVASDQPFRRLEALAKQGLILDSIRPRTGKDPSRIRRGEWEPFLRQKVCFNRETASLRIQLSKVWGYLEPALHRAETDAREVGNRYEPPSIKQCIGWGKELERKAQGEPGHEEAADTQPGTSATEHVAKVKTRQRSSQKPQDDSANFKKPELLRLLRKSRSTIEEQARTIEEQAQALHDQAATIEALRAEITRMNVAETAGRLGLANLDVRADGIPAA